MMSSEMGLHNGTIQNGRPENSSMVGLHHIEFNHLSFFFLSRATLFCLMQTTLRRHVTYACSGFKKDWKEAKKERLKRKMSATM